MKVYFVGAGPGDPDLMTVKARRLLEECNICIYAGSLVSPAVLGLLPVGAERYDSAGMDLQEICAVYRQAHERDMDVIRLHSGDPSIYGAIREQMNELDKWGIEYNVVPGVSSFQASAAALHTELTAPGVAQTVVLTRTSGRTPVPDEQSLNVLGQTHATLCIFLSAHKIRDVAATLSTCYGPRCPAAVVYHASWPDELIVRGVLEDIGDKVESAGIRKTAMIVVGEALSRELAASLLYDPGFSHQYRVGQEI